MTTTIQKQSAVDFFRDKLAFETTPHSLEHELQQGSMLALDVRDKDSFAKERIPGARNIPLQELAGRLAELPKDKPIATYCWNITCALATKAALELAEKGFEIKELRGGIESWKAHFPTEGTEASKK